MRRRAALLGIAAMLAAPAVRARAADLEPVRVGYNPSGTSDTLFFLARRLNYFQQESLDVDLLPFDSGANEVALLAAGQLDVAGGGLSAQLYDAIARGGTLRVVADLASDPPGYGFEVLVVRNDLIRSGRFKTLKDLKGMTIALSAPGSSSWSVLDQLLKKEGLHFDQVRPVFIPFPHHPLALQEKVVDAALTLEPGATQAVQQGLATAIVGDDAFYPNEEIAVVAYSGQLIKNRRDVGLRFMRAYLRAARYYNDALAHGRLEGPNADTVVSVITNVTDVKNAAVVRAAHANGTNPNGRLYLASMRKDLAFYRQLGMIHGSIKAEDCVDESFAIEADRQLGPYVQKH